jgi:hypothetical protein
MHSATLIVFLAIWLGLCHGRVLRNITRNTANNVYNQTQQLTGQAAKYTYWVDDSCLKLTSPYTDSFFDDSLDSMFEMACAVAESLKPDPVVDDDFARVFQMLFSTDVDDTKLYQQSSLWRTRFGTRLDSGDKTAKAMVYGTISHIAHHHASTDLQCADTMNSICTDWYETSNRASSNMRIYCDNGENI